MATAENVDMQVRHGFAAVFAVVDDEPIAILQIKLLRDFGGLEQKMAEQFLVVRRRLGDAWNRLLRNNQNVRRRCGIDVAKGQHKIIFKDNLRRDFARNDFFKKGFAHAETLDTNCPNFH